MKHIIKKCLITLSALSLVESTLYAQETLESENTLSKAFKEANASGQLRMFSISRQYDFSDPTKEDYRRKATAIGGHLKYETGAMNGLRLGVAAYTTNGLFLESPRTDYTVVDPTLFGKDNESYAMVGEAYLEYKYGNTTFKGGRQLLKTPMADADDSRMIPNLFEAYMLTNTDIANTTIIGGHITRFAQGTYGRTKNGGVGAATAGYSYIDSRDRVGEFVNVGEYALGKNTNGISVAAVKHNVGENIKLQLWDYYAYDILNIVYAQADFWFKDAIAQGVTPFASFQFIKENSVGKEYIGAVDSTFWGAKAGVNIENLTASLAYTENGKNKAGDATLYHAVVSMWGGMPAFTKGMVSRHMFVAGTEATKAELSYNWKNFGLNVISAFYYVDIDTAPYNNTTYGDASESGFDLIYNATKTLKFHFRGNFADDYKVSSNGATDGWDEYRFIVTQNF